MHVFKLKKEKQQNAPIKVVFPLVLFVFFWGVSFFNCQPSMYVYSLCYEVRCLLIIVCFNTQKLLQCWHNKLTYFFNLFRFNAKLRLGHVKMITVYICKMKMVNKKMFLKGGVTAIYFGELLHGLQF